MHSNGGATIFIIHVSAGVYENVKGDKLFLERLLKYSILY
jgi:hypothetical protein